MEQTAKTAIYYIVRNEVTEVEKDFADFVYNLGFYRNLNIIQKNPKLYSISGQIGHTSTLEEISNVKLPDHEFLNEFKLKYKLEMATDDMITFNQFVKLAAEQKYNIYSTLNNCFIPRDTAIMSLELGGTTVETHKLFDQLNFKPIYMLPESGIIYAQDSSGEMYIVNPFLLNFLMGKDFPEKRIEEFSYKVAPNLQDFAVMYERNLIPTNFYQQYKKGTKIINNSQFNINNPGRKVFVKPYIFEIKDNTFEPYMIAGDNSTLLVMSKILKGETLDGTIKRVLSQDLKIADDYVGAYVAPKIEFDRDRDGILTPRLIVFIYVKDIKNKDWANRMSQTSWKSMNGNLPKSFKLDDAPKDEHKPFEDDNLENLYQIKLSLEEKLKSPQLTNSEAIEATKQDIFGIDMFIKLATSELEGKTFQMIERSNDGQSPIHGGTAPILMNIESDEAPKDENIKQTIGKYLYSSNQEKQDLAYFTPTLVPLTFSWWETGTTKQVEGMGTVQYDNLRGFIKVSRELFRMIYPDTTL